MVLPPRMMTMVQTGILGRKAMVSGHVAWLSSSAKGNNEGAGASVGVSQHDTLPRAVRLAMERWKSDHEGLSQKVSAADVAPKEFVRMSKELGTLAPKVGASQEYHALLLQLADLDSLLADAHVSGDKELLAMATQERESLSRRRGELHEDLMAMFLPHDEMDDGSAIVEVRAGTGGEEATLFTRDIFQMYEKYSLAKRWRFEILDMQRASGVGGLRVCSPLLLYIFPF